MNTYIKERCPICGTRVFAHLNYETEEYVIIDNCGHFVIEGLDYDFLDE